MSFFNHTSKNSYISQKQTKISLLRKDTNQTTTREKIYLKVLSNGPSVYHNIMTDPNVNHEAGVPFQKPINLTRWTSPSSTAGPGSIVSHTSACLPTLLTGSLPRHDEHDVSDFTMLINPLTKIPVACSLGATKSIFRINWMYQGMFCSRLLIEQSQRDQKAVLPFIFIRIYQPSAEISFFQNLQIF